MVNIEVSNQVSASHRIQYRLSRTTCVQHNLMRSANNIVNTGCAQPKHKLSPWVSNEPFLLALRTIQDNPQTNVL
jgi:hypothetical protein